MPRENRMSKVARLTRSGHKDPSWETIVVLQERVKILERLARRGERSKALKEEVTKLKADLEKLSDARALHCRNGKLELENLNLKNRVARLEELLQLLGTPAPAPFDRSFSTFEFS